MTVIYDRQRVGSWQPPGMIERRCRTCPGGLQRSDRDGEPCATCRYYFDRIEPRATELISTTHVARILARHRSAERPEDVRSPRRATDRHGDPGESTIAADDEQQTLVMAGRKRDTVMHEVDVMEDPDEQARRRAEDLDALNHFGIDGRDPDRIARCLQRDAAIVTFADEVEGGRDLDSLPTGIRRPVRAELEVRRRNADPFFGTLGCEL